MHQVELTTWRVRVRFQWMYKAFTAWLHNATSPR